MSTNVKKVLMLAVVGLVLFYLVTEPQDTAASVKALFGALVTLAEAVKEFVTALTS